MFLNIFQCYGEVKNLYPPQDLSSLIMILYSEKKNLMRPNFF